MKRENIEKPSVTILVPVYNGESSICACMDSLVNQTLKKKKLYVSRIIQRMLQQKFYEDMPRGMNV